MNKKFHDILKKTDRPPLWWQEGVPRFEPFSPDLVATFEVALVHTECRECGTIYIVAVSPWRPLFHSLRDIIAYTSSLEIGDPPFACRELGAKRCGAGYSMSSLELEILEFWHRNDLRSPWQRDPDLEKPLIDYRGDAPYEHPVHLRIHDSERRDEWMAAKKAGDLQTMEKILLEVGCERPERVATMVELDRRFEEFWRDIREFRQERRSGIS